MTLKLPTEDLQVSIVIGVYNEEENIRPLLSEIRNALRGYMYEIIIVNDGSTDGSLAEALNPTVGHPVVVDLQKNYGQSQAMAAGIEVARGKYIVTIDGDGQNDPADIPSMLTLAQKDNYDLVASVRKRRKDNYFTRKLPSQLANALIRRLVGVHLHDYGSTLKVFRASLAKKLPLYGELHRFIPVLAAIEGARMTEVPVNHRPRLAGTSKYGLGRTVKVMSDLVWVYFLKKYLSKPIHFFGRIAFWLVMGGSGLGALTVTRWWLSPHSTLGSLPLATLLLMLSAGYFLGLGILAELLMRTFYEAKGKKPYTIRQIYYPEFKKK
ncbi:glycosyltransferase [Runella sp. CRIBMP]|uniref:glycosyltransferase family 2 protein n=1 Tax=Runella sp. CRIBMP TaxID=2683261 RepID=UPI0014135612|nr:glycosyltransferase family 2 protein [Runella sp. CRIBMP]NBB22824.1 glycosyltransferase [Runella sp. CRIBMP]